MASGEDVAWQDDGNSVSCESRSWEGALPNEEGMTQYTHMTGIRDLGDEMRGFQRRGGLRRRGRKVSHKERWQEG